MLLKVLLDWINNNNPLRMIYRYFYRRKFFRKAPIEIINPQEAKEFEIYTVAFNNAKVIEYQIKLCEKNIKDEFLHIIIDNSIDKKASSDIKNVCIKYKKMYIRLPQNTLYSSQHHTLALNYTWINIVQKRMCRYFWFLDHDIFPVKKTSILPILKQQKLYGYLIDKYRRWFMWNAWFLWPWFSFFDKTLSRKFDFGLVKHFLPFYALDSWWANYNLIYKKLNKDAIQFADKELFWVDYNLKKIHLTYDLILDWKPPLKKVYYTYEEIKNWEWIHKWGTYFLWDKNSELYKDYLSTIECFFENLEGGLKKKTK